jgi:hypothetical protein
MNEILRFEGEVRLPNLSLPQVIFTTKHNTFESIARIPKKTNNCTVLIHTEGATSTTTDKFYKFYTNGTLTNSSFFSPKKIFLISNVSIPKRIKADTDPNTAFKSELFEIKIFSSNLEDSKEIYTLRIHLFRESFFLNVQYLLDSQNPSIWSNFMNNFKLLCSKFSLLSFEVSGRTVQISSSLCEMKKFVLQRNKNKPLIVKFKDIEMIKMTMPSSFYIQTKVKQKLSFTFDIGMKDNVSKILSAIQLFRGCTFINYSLPEIEFDLRSENSKKLCKKEFSVQQQNYSEDIIEMEYGKKFEILVNIKEKYSGTKQIQVFQGEENISTATRICKGTNVISLEKINPKKSITLKISNQNLLVFTHKIHLIEGGKEFSTDETNSEILEVSEMAENTQNSMIIEIPIINPSHVHTMEMTEFNEINHDLHESNEDDSIINELSVYSWSVDQVYKWIRRIGPVYVDTKFGSIFRENKINGNALMEITNSDLIEMGIKLWGHRNKILNEIKKLKKEIK